ncbi:WD40/YVTN/BNR-like repeat-containing protein [Psychroserpens algicola]|uniref:Oxidoreductase n=1 Tax=Psychroserpens algicola TaxID=1719034 RepID=A0ABT0H6L4_9FLAO|nr:oxidoreductase [Psychroserpens algicola]MCK8479467.1 oxidoreductase [Psychroserpens algicola]
MKKEKLLVFVSIVTMSIMCYGLLSYTSYRKHLPSLKQFRSVHIETLVQDSTLNIRALELVDSIGPTYLTSRGEFGILLPNSFINHVDSLKEKSFYHHKINLSNDTLQLNFRALSALKEKGFGITIGSPALLYQLNADLEKNKIVYEEHHPKAFYDAMEFWNDDEGIAIGDPTADCISIIITRDGGETWTKLLCEDLPKIKEGEAAFAASDSNIAIVGTHTWIATGGKVSRILYSSDKGKTWEIYDTPIVQGLETTGMYSIDFYDRLNGFGIGGDYTRPADSSANKIRTHDGGKTWQLVAINQSPGYRSCVQYVPNGEGKALVAIGFNGIDYSSDAGNSWTHLSDEGFYTIRFLNDSVAYAAGNGRLSKLTFKE